MTRAYDVATGQVLWTIRTDVAGGDDETLSVATPGRNIVIGGSAASAGPNGTQSPDVRAYDGATGRLLWEDLIPDALGGGFVFKVVAHGEKVVAAAIANDDWLIRAYNARTGKVLWTKTFSELGAPVEFVFDGPVQLAMDDDVVLVGGYGSTQPYGTEIYPGASRDWVVRAYETRTGRLLWSDVRGSPTDIDEVDGGVILRGGQAFALGLQTDVTGMRHTVLRAYHARTGKLRWKDVVDREGFPFGVTITLAAARGRLTAVSYVQGTRPPGTPSPESLGRNLLVRTYDIDDDHHDRHDDDEDGDDHEGRIRRDRDARD